MTTFPSIDPTPSSLLQVIDAGIGSATLGAREIVEMFADRIAKQERRTRAFTTLCVESALDRAETLDRGRAGASRRAMPLLGMPIAVKDNIDVAGVRCTVGSLFYRDYVPTADAVVIDRLHAAGALVIGKATTHEFMYGATTDNPHFGAVVNPWDAKRVPGGSSGGSAVAVAADMAWGGLGTDSGGSIRIPASINGVTGLRPTYGAVSNAGVFPMSTSVDTTGPIARSAADVAEMFAVISDDNSGLRTWFTLQGSSGIEVLRGLRIGLPTTYFFDEVQADIREAANSAVEVLTNAGASSRGIALPGGAGAARNASTITRAETYALHRERMAKHPDLFGADVRERLRVAARVTESDLEVAYQGMRAWSNVARRVFADVDVVVTPTCAISPPLARTADTDAITSELTRLTYPWSLAGLPALSLPCGLDSVGMPIGLQLVGPPHSEFRLLAIAAGFQLQTDWHKLRPNNPPRSGR